jgi:hypothetical protein
MAMFCAAERRRGAAGTGKRMNQHIVRSLLALGALTVSLIGYAQDAAAQ